MRILKSHALVALMLATVARAADEPIIGVPWTGEPGITETVEQIMERQRLKDRRKGRSIPVRARKPKLPLPPKGEPNPDSLAVAQWPPAPTRLEGQPIVSRLFNPQTIGVNFLGISRATESFFIPPDSMGAVGPTQFFVLSNGRLKVFGKDGTPGPLNVDDDTFWTSVSNGEFVSDPHVRYDRLSGRWFLSIVNLPVDVNLNPVGPNRVLIAVSSGSTITGAGSFTFFQFQQDLVGPTPNSDTNGLADYDTLGVDKLALYIGANMFDQSATTFLGSTGFVVNKANLIGGTLTATAFRQIAAFTGVGATTPQGVANDDPAASEGYFIGVDAAPGRLVLRRVSNPGGSPTISGNLNITVPLTIQPIPVTARDVPSFPLDALDDRLFAAMIHKNKITGLASLWTAHNIEVNASGVATGGGGRDGSRWYEIGSLTTSPTLVQSGTLFDPAGSNPRSFWIPSVAASGQGHMALGSSFASVNDYAGVAVAGRLSGDAANMTQAATIAQPGLFAYDDLSTDPQRWGDYSQTTVDPNDDMTLWTVQEYAQSSAVAGWGLRVVQLKAPPPAVPDCSVPAQVTTGSPQNATITGIASAGSGFFDPGPDTGGPGFANHLQASVSGGVTVNSVTFNGPTSVTLNVTAPTIGSKDVTITNPDGQSVIGSGCILVLGPPADLSITKTDGQATAALGAPITYTIVASNAGPNPVSGATVTDTVPAAITGATWTCVGSGAATCTASGVGNISDTVNLPVGDTVAYTLTGTVSPAASSPIVNTATVTAPVGLSDPNPANNTATDTDTIPFACGAEIVVVPDGRLTSTSIPAMTTLWFGGSLKIGDSYSIEFKNQTGVNVPPGTVTVFSGDDACSGASTVIVNDTSGSDPGGTPGTVRLSFTAAGTGTFFHVRLVNGSGSPVTFTFGLSDTTMYSPAWSTNGSFNTFYSFQNTTGTAFNGTLTLLDTGGVVQSTFSVPIPAGQTASTNTQALGVTRNRTGTAKFTHNGPPGAIVAEAAIANFSISPAYVQPVKFLPVRDAR